MPFPNTAASSAESWIMATVDGGYLKMVTFSMSVDVNNAALVSASAAGYVSTT